MCMYTHWVPKIFFFVIFLFKNLLLIHTTWVLPQGCADPLILVKDRPLPIRLH